MAVKHNGNNTLEQHTSLVEVGQSVQAHLAVILQ